MKKLLLLVVMMVATSSILGNHMNLETTPNGTVKKEIVVYDSTRYEFDEYSAEIYYETDTIFLNGEIFIINEQDALNKHSKPYKCKD